MKGSDSYLFARGNGQDTIVKQDSTWLKTDLLKIGGATSRQLWFTKVGNHFDVSVIGTSDKVTIHDRCGGNATHVEKSTASDGKSMSHTKVNALVSAMSAFTLSALRQATLPASTQTALNTVLW